MREFDNIVPGQRSNGIKRDWCIDYIVFSHFFYDLELIFGEHFKLKSKYN